MKIRRRALTLLLAVVMVLTFMPAMAFASSDAAKPVSITFSSASPVEGYIGSTGPQIWREGNSVTVKYSDGKSKTYKYSDEEGEYFLNGDPSKERLGDIWAYTDRPIKKGNNQATVAYQYDESDYDSRVETKITVVGISNSDIKKVTFKQNKSVTADIREPYNWDESSNMMGDEVIIDYGDYTRKYTYQENPEYKGDYGFICKVTEDDYTWYDFAWLDYVFEKEPHEWSGGKTYTADVYFEGVKASGTMTVKVKAAPKPVKAQFVPVKGFTAKAMIGQDYLSAESLFKKGNKFVISYSDGTKRTYKYKNKERGFVYTYPNGDTDSIWGFVELKKAVPKGTKTLKGTIGVWAAGYDKDFNLSISVKVKASKYYTYIEYKPYQYTGKKISPKVRVKYYNGKKMKTMPSSWYTAQVTKSSKVGSHSIKVNFKKKYQSKYGKSIKGFYDIVPKKPTISSAKAGTGSITVSWKKFSSADRKNISGFRVECSTDKNFEKNVEFFETGKTASKFTISDLEKGKKYYVCIRSFKTVPRDKTTYWILSMPSKTKSAIVK